MRSWGYAMPTADELIAALFQGESVEWRRIGLFQGVTLRLIADRMAQREASAVIACLALNNDNRDALIAAGSLRPLLQGLLPAPAAGADGKDKGLGFASQWVQQVSASPAPRGMAWPAGAARARARTGRVGRGGGSSGGRK